MLLHARRAERPETWHPSAIAGTGVVRGRRHTECMDQKADYAVTLDELVTSAKVPFEEQVEEQALREHTEHDESAGHLPGNVRPYGA